MYIYLLLHHSINMSDDFFLQTFITYLPPIHRPTNGYDTVMEYLQQVQGLGEQVHMQHVHLALDVAAAAKAYHVLWNFPDEFNNVIFLLGNFHRMGKLVSGKDLKIYYFLWQPAGSLGWQTLQSNLDCM